MPFKGLPFVNHAGHVAPFNPPPPLPSFPFLPSLCAVAMQAGVYSGAAIASNETTLLTIRETTFEGNGGPRGAIWAGRNVSMDELELRVINCSLNSNYISQPTDQDQRGGAMLLASLARCVGVVGVVGEGY